MSYELHMKMGTGFQIYEYNDFPSLKFIKDKYKNSSFILYKAVPFEGDILGKELKFIAEIRV